MEPSHRYGRYPYAAPTGRNCKEIPFTQKSARCIRKESTNSRVLHIDKTQLFQKIWTNGCFCLVRLKILFSLAQVLQYDSWHSRFFSDILLGSLSA